MTRSLAVDGDNDIYIGPGGSLAVASGLEAVLQNCAQAAKAQIGEMVFSIDTGMPNFAAVWNGTPNIGVFEAYLRQTLLAVQDVTGIESISIAAGGGALTYTAVIQTIYGRGALNGL